MDAASLALVAAAAGFVAGAGAHFLLNWEVRIRVGRCEWSIDELTAELGSEKKKRAAAARWNVGTESPSLDDVAAVGRAVARTPWWRNHVKGPANGS